MPNTGKELESLKRALDDDWPEIQKHLSGAGAGVDSWWLDRFDRKDVILQLPGIAIMNTADWHTDAASFTLRDTYGLRNDEDCADCFTEEDLLAHIERFPQGQFAAVRISGPGAGQAVALAVTMRTSRPPSAPILPWREAIGDMRLGAHEPAGDWLYGVEMAVRPMYQKHGIGTALYEARFALIRKLNLRGWYMVGMLMGYRDYADEMGAVEYGDKVIAREINDPTVTMQMNRGFRPQRVIADYVDEAAAGNAGVLLIWDNPHYDPGPAT